MRKILSLVVIPLAFVGAFAGTALAQGVATDEGSILEIARPVLEAALAGQPGLAAALALVLLAAAVRRYGASRWPVLATDAGGALIVLVGAFGSAAAAGITGGAVWSLALVWTALKVAASAAGGYSLIKRLIVAPVLRPLRNRLPVWARPLLDMLLWIFDGGGSRVAAAEAAGAAAVAATPSEGAAGVVGAPRDMP